MRAVLPATHTGRPARRAVHRVARTVWEYLPSALLLAGLVALWEVWVRVADTPGYILPAPSRIWSAFLETRGALGPHVRTTMGEALIGLLVAAGAGLVLAALMALVPLVRRTLYPIIVVSQTLPMLVLAPLLAIWLGLGMTPKVVIVALIGFFPIVVSTVDALINADDDMAGLVRSMGGRRLAVLRHVLIPSALPAFFAGLKIAATYAVLGAVIGESAGASSGLGIFITRTHSSFRIDRVFVAVVLIALLSIALFAIVQLLARLATPWMYVRQEEEKS